MDGRIATILDSYFDGRRPTLWATRARPKIDRIACPWLIRRFLDPQAEFLFAPQGEVLERAAAAGAVAFDLPGGAFTHVGAACSFDAFVERFEIDDAALARLRPIIRGADTDDHHLAPEAAGLHAVSIGLSRLYTNDHALLAQGFVIYDALYAWASGADERHAWTGVAQ